MKEMRAKNGRPVPCLPGPASRAACSNLSSANIPELPKALCFPGAGKGKHKTPFHKQPRTEGQADGFAKSQSPADYKQRPKQGKESQPSLGPSRQHSYHPKCKQKEGYWSEKSSFPPEVYLGALAVGSR